MLSLIFAAPADKCYSFGVLKPRGAPLDAKKCDDRSPGKHIQMETKHSAFLTVGIFPLFFPLLAFAQQPTGSQQPPWDWPGPWHMWSGGWGFWWIFPLFMLVMFIVCVAIFFLGHRSGSGQHHWGPWQRMDRGHPWGDPTYSALRS